jgi:hypothetical protein
MAFADKVLLKSVYIEKGNQCKPKYQDLLTILEKVQLELNFDIHNIM